MKLKGLIHQTTYRLSRHYSGGWTLLRWLILLLLIAPILSVTKTFFQWPPWGWLPLAIAALFSAAIFFTLWQSKRRGHICFLAGQTPRLPQLPPTELPFPQKIPLRASGNFSVEGQTRYFVEENAFYQTFATRERVIMVNVSFTRLLFAPSPKAEIGWWYSFFTPKILVTYQPGTLCFGASPRPALQLRYYPNEDSKKTETVYLSFDSPENLAIVLADLQADKII